MRMKRALALCLPFVLVACSGGLLPTPTIAPSSPVALATASATPALAQAMGLPTMAASPTPSPAEPVAVDLVAAPERAPEIAGGLVGAEDRDRYTRFVGALRSRDAASASWLVSTGLFLRDGKIDDQEQRVMDLILNREDDPLWYLAHVRVQDGVSSQDVDFLGANSGAPSATWFLDDDIRGLQAYQPLSHGSEQRLQWLLAKAREDIELRKGLAIINAMGLPDSRAFKYPVPLYNIQLSLLVRLLEQGLPAGYERAAVAAACTYGSLATLCDEGARAQVLSYAGERLRFLIDTDVMLAAAGAHWRATSYPLEDLMLLLWGGQATAFPQAGQPLAESPSLLAAAAARPLTKNDLTNLLVRLDNLRQMQDEMVRVAVERTTDERKACDLVEQWWSEHCRGEADEGGPDLNRQWDLYRSGQGFAGGVEAAYVLQGLAASLNLPVPWAQLWFVDQGQLHTVPFGLRLDPANGILWLGSSARQAIGDLPAETKAVLVWWRVPWDNWHLGEGVRGYQTLPLPLAIWQAGIPSGYLLRQSVAKDGEVLALLGLAPTARPISSTSVKEK